MSITFYDKQEALEYKRQMEEEGQLVILTKFGNEYKVTLSSKKLPVSPKESFIETDEPSETIEPKVLLIKEQQHEPTKYIETKLGFKLQTSSDKNVVDFIPDNMLKEIEDLHKHNKPLEHEQQYSNTTEFFQVLQDYYDLATGTITENRLDKRINKLTKIINEKIPYIEKDIETIKEWEDEAEGKECELLKSEKFLSKLKSLEAELSIAKFGDKQSKMIAFDNFIATSHRDFPSLLSQEYGLWGVGADISDVILSKLANDE